MKIATWNVNSLNARWPRVEEFLTTRDVDVVLLQETKQRDDKFPSDALQELGYSSAHFGFNQWNGVAILSRVGLSEVVRGFGDREDEEARCIAATCDGVRVMSCYVPNGRAVDNPHYAYKLEWLETLRLRVAAHPKDVPLVVGGDFNVAPEDIDCYDPSAFVGATHVTEPERTALRAVTDEGLTDIFRHLYPDDVQYTWWDYRNGSFRRGWGLRIDLLLCSPHVTNRATAAWVDRDARKGEKPSDHAPVIVEFSL
ncbi:MAG: exodeoxyribonuclease III [Acidobacteria bacterium]|nr:exodeoxyribonuclease III [Acidobacteriota bacterium]